METFPVPASQFGKSMWPLTVKPRSRSRTVDGAPLGSVTWSTSKSELTRPGNWIWAILVYLPNFRSEHRLSPLSRGVLKRFTSTGPGSDAGGTHGAHVGGPRLIAACL